MGRKNKVVSDFLDLYHILNYQSKVSTLTRDYEEVFSINEKMFKRSFIEGDSKCLDDIETLIKEQTTHFKLLEDRGIITKKKDEKEKRINPIQQHINMWDSGYAISFLIYTSKIGQQYRNECIHYSLKKENIYLIYRFKDFAVFFQYCKSIDKENSIKELEFNKEELKQKKIIQIQIFGHEENNYIMPNCMISSKHSKYGEYLEINERGQMVLQEVCTLMENLLSCQDDKQNKEIFNINL